MTDPIYLIGPSADRTLAHFQNFLAERRIPATLIPLDRLYQSGSVRLAAAGLACRWDDQLVSIPYHGARIFSRLNRSLDDQPAAQNMYRILFAFLQRAQGVIINRPAAGRLNFSKAAQTWRMQQAGANVPASLLSNHAEAAQRFADQHPAIFKSPSSVRSQVAEFTPAQTDRLGYLSTSPVLFQQKIEGQDVRVHVVDDQYHAEAIAGTTVDYRYADPTELVYQNHRLPDNIAALCLELTQDSGLLFSGIDLKLDTDGNYWFLEINPMPGYEDYDRRGDLHISRLLVDLLQQ